MEQEHREFEITVPPGQGRAVELRVRVQAPTWLEALAEAGRRLRDELGVTISGDRADPLDRPIRVRELASGRQYVVSSLAAEAPASGAGRGASGERPTLLTRLDDPGQAGTRPLPRAQVRSPQLQRRGARVKEGAEGATRLDLGRVPGGRPPGDRVRTPPAWRQRRPVVRSDRLRPRRRPLHVTTPMDGTWGGALFKPVTDLDLLPGDVDSLIDAAVAMLADHIPCTLIQAALWLDDREGLWVASASGHLADEVRHAVLRFPRGFLPQGPGIEGPLTHQGEAVALTYEDEVGGVLRVDVDRLLCVPIRVERVPLGLFVLAGPERGEGFTKPDVSGVTYLAKTIGAKVAGVLSQRDTVGDGPPGG